MFILIICVFMFMTHLLFLHLRERKAKLPLLFSSQSSLQRESQPLQTFLICTLILLFSLSSFFDKEDDPFRLQYYTWRPTIVLLHSIIIFSGLFSKPPTSNSLAPCLYPLWHAEQSFSPSRPRCHSGIFTKQPLLLCKSCFHWQPWAVLTLLVLGSN